MFKKKAIRVLACLGIKHLWKDGAITLSSLDAVRRVGGGGAHRGRPVQGSGSSVTFMMKMRRSHWCDFHDENVEEPCLPLHPLCWASPALLESSSGRAGVVLRVPRIPDAAACLHQLMAMSLSTRTGQEVLFPGPEIDFLFKT